MPKDPFTIRIFVADGDPQGVRVIDRMNWTGLGIVVPREKWPSKKQRAEFSHCGVYILQGYEYPEDELPTLYVGESDVIRYHIDSHFQNMDFWNRAIVFTSSNNGLNTTHVRWLEHALVKHALEAKQSHLQNGNELQEPMLHEADRADMKAFLEEILQILPLVGLRAFEIPEAVVEPTRDGPQRSELNTVVVPAQTEGFEKVFLGEKCWYAIRISGGMLSRIKFIAAYRTQPESAVTHYAPVALIEPYGEDGKYRLIFAERAKPIGPISFADAPQGSMQGPRYTTLGKLLRAKKLTELF